MRFAILLIGWWALSAHAVDFKFERRGSTQVLLVQNIPLPDDIFKKQIRTGLTTTVLTQLILTRKKSETPLKISRTFLIFYDLWDEVYQMKTVELDSLRKSAEKDPAAVMRVIQFQEFVMPPNLLTGENIEVSVHVTLNPISKEKMHKIRRWLAQNNVNLPSTGGAQAATPTTATAAIITGGLKVSAPSAPPVSPIAGARFSGVLTQVLNSELADDSSGAWVFASPLQTVALPSSKGAQP